MERQAPSSTTAFHPSQKFGICSHRTKPHASNRLWSNLYISWRIQVDSDGVVLKGKASSSSPLLPGRFYGRCDVLYQRIHPNSLCSKGVSELQWRYQARRILSFEESFVLCAPKKDEDDQNVVDPCNHDLRLCACQFSRLSHCSLSHEWQ